MHWLRGHATGVTAATPLYTCVPGAIFAAVSAVGPAAVEVF